MKLVKLLWSEDPVTFTICVVLSFLNSAATVFLLTLITRGFGAQDATSSHWFGLVVLLLVLGISVTIVPMMTWSMARKVVAAIRWKLLGGIFSAQLSKFERIGVPTLLASLTEDGAILTTALPGGVSLVRDSSFIVLCTVLLTWIAPMIALIAIGVMLIVGGVSYVLRGRAIREEILILQDREMLFGMFGNLLSGAKDVRTRSELRDALSACIAETDEKVRQRVTRATGYSSTVDSVTTVSLFLALTVAVYGNFDRGVVGVTSTTYVALLIMMMAPMRSVTGTLQLLAQGQVALERVKKLTALLSESTSSMPQFARVPPSIVDTTTELIFRDVRYTYGDAREADFTVGPINFSVSTGQVMFVTGGNGSGKTTFAKLLNGLYIPTQGAISLNGAVIDEESRAWFMGQFSSVYYDFCLFESLAGTRHDPVISDLTDLLVKTRLTHLIELGGQLLSQSRKLSSGQRRRVALLLSLISDRRIFVFDEFAADQDPETRDLFYESLLPELRSRGKIVIAITHDTRYFHCCDVALTFERGQVPQVFWRQRDERKERSYIATGQS